VYTVPLATLLDRHPPGVLARLARGWAARPAPCHPACRLTWVALSGDPHGPLVAVGIASCGYGWSLPAA
jgi:hypothetical protein